MEQQRTKISRAFPEGSHTFPEGSHTFPESSRAFPEGRRAFPEGRPDFTKGNPQTLTEQNKNTIILIEDDFFHKNFNLCSPDIEEITVRFCMYSITYPFYVEGMPITDERTNIYGRVFTKYNEFYPCVEWVATQDFQFPSIKYDCTPTVVVSPFVDDETDENTTRFENEIHTFFLSFFKDDVYSMDILSSGYKGFSYDDATSTAYVFYDFSPIHDLFLSKDTRLVLSDELKGESIFTKYSFLTRINGYPSPSLLYMCIYDSDKKEYVNVDIDMEPSKYIAPLEHPILGCIAYYFTETPLSGDASRLVRFACIQSRIMYEVRIEGNEVFYMGDNVAEFQEDFEMGVLMCSTLHFEENGRRFIAIKARETIFPLLYKGEIKNE